MKTKIITSYLAVLFLIIGLSFHYANAATNTDPNSTGNTGNEDTYQTPPSNYNPGSCPDPAKEYRDAQGNCVPYDESNYGGAPNKGYDPGNTGKDSYGNTPGYDCSSGVCFPNSTNLPDPSGGVIQIISKVLYWILTIFGFLALIAFIISGIQYILSTGDERAIDAAKRSMKWAIVGVVVALSGLVIVYAIDQFLRGTPQY